MLKPKEMTEVRIISHSGNIRPVIETLYDLKILHIIDFKKGELDIGKPLNEASFYSEHLIAARSALSRLGIQNKPQGIDDIRDAQKKFPGLDKEFKNVAANLDELKDEENRMAAETNNPLTALGLTRSNAREYKSLASFTGTVKISVEPQIAALTSDYILVQKKLDRRIAMALFVKKGFENNVKEILARAGFVECELPKSGKAEIGKDLANIRKEINALEKELAGFKAKNAQFIADYEFALTQLNEKAEAPLRFASTKNTFIATGWVPSDTATKLQQNLNRAAKGKISVETLHGNNPPTVLENPKTVNSFEFLVNLYSLPRSYEIDPTVLMFITFPLFFGFMLGDVGYGLISLGMMLLLERKLAGAKPLIRIMTIASLASILFGFVFGEAFGYEFVEHPILNRVHDVQMMMLISIMIGVIHINFGFVLGFINELKHHSFVMSFFKKGSWILLQAGVAALAFIPSMKIAGGIIALASVVMIIKGEGLKVVEIPGVLSNILSYIRLYAIGLSSVSLAGVINHMAFGLFAGGGIGIVFGIIILLLGHAVNLLLGLLGPFLHSVRLHYVEFFQKFYEGGGYFYRPFGLLTRRSINK